MVGDERESIWGLLEPRRTCRGLNSGAPGKSGVTAEGMWKLLHGEEAGLPQVFCTKLFLCGTVLERHFLSL